MLNPDFVRLMELINARAEASRAVATLPAGGAASIQANRAIAQLDRTMEEYAAALQVVPDEEIVLPQYEEDAEGVVRPRPGFPNPLDVDTPR